ncbi:butyrophilin subfamily 3 member A3 isoform X2 [Eucyclogobius newberryi]|uniref:butyrophilin subfamily 3 member A3 isoform X1 n=1 Tax=Eucyclogobius newberryi TaxID=166745 RepID=UPI003B5BFAFD
MIRECLHFLVEPAKKLKIRLKESRKKVKLEQKEPLLESQLFVMELARELNKICQRSNVLSHIWTGQDVWPPCVCRDFIVQWSSELEKHVQPCSRAEYERPQKSDWREQLLCMLESGGEADMGAHKRLILDWSRQIRSSPEPSVWPGEPVLMILDDLEFQWKRGRLPTLLPAMELVLLAVINGYSPIKEDVPKQWLLSTQSRRSVDALRYVPHGVWNWMCESAEEVVLDPDTAHADLLLSEGDRCMRCVPERGQRDVACGPQRFTGWWCAAAQDGFTSGTHYWEVEVGDRDWRVGVASESAVRRGYSPLNTHTGFLTLRLERGSELKALTVPPTPLPRSLAPRTLGLFLDYDQGQLSFYDVDKRSHLYTFSHSFAERVVPVFGTVEVLRDLVIRPAQVRHPCLCPGACLWT